MKLSTRQVKEVLNQLEAQVIPADHPAVPQLEASFGAHTFFLGSEGLHVVERSNSNGSGEQGATVVKVASWADNQKTSLRPQEAEHAGSIDIGPAEDEPTA